MDFNIVFSIGIFDIRIEIPRVDAAEDADTSASAVPSTRVIKIRDYIYVIPFLIPRYIRTCPVADFRCYGRRPGGKRARQKQKREERKVPAVRGGGEGGTGVQDVRRRRRGLGIDPEPPLSCLKVRLSGCSALCSPPSTSCKKPARNEYS